MKNIEYVNKKVAKELGLSEDIVAKINDFYWSTVKKEMRNLDNEFIYIKKIGSFEVSGTKLEKQIVKLRQYIRNIRFSNKYGDVRKEQIINDYKKMYSKCLQMRKQVNETLTLRNTYNV